MANLFNFISTVHSAVLRFITLRRTFFISAELYSLSLGASRMLLALYRNCQHLRRPIPFTFVPLAPVLY
ncbi:MAG: hypothetical protein ACTS4V_01075 [Candidatus Hodgkinia cicadicola]